MDHAGDYHVLRGRLIPMEHPHVEVGVGVLRPNMARTAGGVAITWMTPPGYDMLRRAGVPADPAYPVAGPAALVDSGTYLYGSADHIAARLEEFRDAGVVQRPAPTPSPHPGGVLYRVPGAVSVARLLPSGDDTAFRLSGDALADLGRTLRRLHQEPWDLPERPPHHGVRRLLTWLAGEETAPGATRLRALARTRLGPSLWARLTDWSEAAAEPPAGGRDAVLLHGAPSSGWLVPSPTGGHTALLTGEEVTGGDPALDLGWILGELHELRAAARGLGSAGKGPRVDHPTAAHALLSGYTGSDGTAALPRGTARAATLRLAVHLRDFASFVGRHEDLRHYCDLLAEALTEGGAPCLRRPEEGLSAVVSCRRRPSSSPSGR